MKLSAFLLVLLTPLALTPTAVAGPPSVGSTLCDPSSGNCITVGAADCVRQIRYDATFGVTTYEVAQYLGIAGMPCPTATVPVYLRQSGLAYTQTRSDGSLLSVASNPLVQEGLLVSYCNGYTDYNARQGSSDLPAKVSTPPALYERCNADPVVPHFTRYANQPVAETGGESGPVTEKPAAAKPASTKGLACAALPLGKARVAVVAQGLKCAPARNILAAFLRRGVEPKGYICVKARAGKVRSASCGKPLRGAIRVTGRWRG